MTLVIKGNDLNDRLKNIMLSSSCQGDTCDEHDGCGEQCNHAYCRY